MEREHSLVERLTRFSINRRISVLVLLVSVIVVGGVAASGMPVELFPQGFDPPFMRIYIPWQDSPPREVLEKISEPLEEELSTVRGIDRIVSVSRVGSASVYLSFKQGVFCSSNSSFSCVTGSSCHLGSRHYLFLNCIGLVAGSFCLIEVLCCIKGSINSPFCTFKCRVFCPLR
jgi:hypothetical protein